MHTIVRLTIILVRHPVPRADALFLAEVFFLIFSSADKQSLYRGGVVGVWRPCGMWATLEA